MQLYKDHIKRIFDLLIGSTVLFLLWPVMLITAVAIKLDSPGPVIFRQERLGYKGKVFHMYKFRSMKVNSEHTGSGVYSNKNDARVTRVGRIIRAASIDELPQAVNMVMGDVSHRSETPSHLSPMATRRIHARPTSYVRCETGHNRLGTDPWKKRCGVA